MVLKSVLLWSLFGVPWPVRPREPAAPVWAEIVPPVDGEDRDLFRLLLPRSLPFQMLWQMIESLLMEEDLLAWREVPTFLLFVQWNVPGLFHCVSGFVFILEGSVHSLVRASKSDSDRFMGQAQGTYSGIFSV
jgi:hypothetical protein